MVETMRSKLKEDISDDAGQDEVKHFIYKNTVSVNKRLSELFADADVKVTSHTLRKIYFLEAFANHGILMTSMTKLAYSGEIMGHDPS